MGVDFLGADPIYVQIAAVLRQRIRTGVYQPNRQLPGEHALCEEFGVSRNTVRAAIRMLGKEGLTRTVMGRGTFVRTDVDLS